MGNNNGNAVVKQNRTTLRKMLASNEDRLNNLLPAHMTPSRMMSLAMLAVSKTPKLLECDPATVVESINQAASMGLEIGGPMARAHLVPFFNKRRGQMECQLIPDYKGLIQLAIEAGSIVKADARVAYEGEQFEVHYGTRDEIVHVPNIEAIDAARGDWSKIRAFYFVAQLPDGSKKFEVMTRAQVDEIRERSQAGSSGPWQTDPEEMGKKTVTKRGLKYVPSDPNAEASRRLAMAVEADNRFETGKLTAPVPEWDTEDEVASAATQARKDELKKRLEEKGRELEQEEKAEAGDGEGARASEPEATGALEPPPAEADSGPSDFERAKGRYFALAGEAFDGDEERKAWQAEHVGKPSAAHWSTDDYRKAAAMLEEGIGLVEEGEPEPSPAPPADDDPLEEPKGEMPWEEGGGGMPL